LETGYWKLVTGYWTLSFRLASLLWFSGVIVTVTNLTKTTSSSELEEESGIKLESGAQRFDLVQRQILLPSQYVCDDILAADFRKVSHR